MTPPTTSPTPTLRLTRAMRLRCPECGGTGLFRHWVQLRARCPRCGLRLDRGAPDHFVGAYLANLIVAELLFAGCVVVWLLWVWPHVPWERIERVAVIAIVTAPLLTYPFTRTLWLAADLIFDPPRDSDR